MSDEYDIGYRKPPKATQFKPGQSGNRKGRPKAYKNMPTLLDRISNERVTITENGKVTKLTKKEVALRQLMNKAMKGDLRALEKLLTQIGNIESIEAERITRSALTLTAEQATALRERLRLQSATLIPESAVPPREASDD